MKVIDAKNNTKGISSYLENSEVIALPTEAVYGLSCIPNDNAIRKLLRIKQRDSSKGLILVGDNFDKLEKYIDLSHLNKKQIDMIINPSQNLVTWVVPSKSNVSDLITGGRNTIAIRITKYPLLIEICNNLASAVVSTSANLVGHPPAQSAQEVMDYFGGLLDIVVTAPLGGNLMPSQIIDLCSGKVLRS